MQDIRCACVCLCVPVCVPVCVPPCVQDDVGAPWWSAAHLLVRHHLAELLRDALQILLGDAPLVVQVKLPERAQRILLGILLRHLDQQQLQELVEIDHARRATLFLHHRLHLLFSGLESERTQHHFQSARIDHTLALCIEQVKRLPNFRALLFAQFQPRCLHKESKVEGRGCVETPREKKRSVLSGAGKAHVSDAFAGRVVLHEAAAAHTMARNGSQKESAPVLHVLGSYFFVQMAKLEMFWPLSRPHAAPPESENSQQCESFAAASAATARPARHRTPPPGRLVPSAASVRALKLLHQHAQNLSPRS